MSRTQEGAETAERAMSRFFRDNGLTIVLLLLFVASIVGHWITGWHFHNEQLQDHGREPITLIAFLSDPQFLSTVFENRRIRTSPRGQAIRLRGRRSAMLRLPSGAEQQCGGYTATRSGSSYSCSS
jgi:hypothetical protein